MSEKLFCLYGGLLAKMGKSVKMTIASVRTAPKMLYSQDGTKAAWDIMFKEKNKAGETIYIQIPKRDNHGKSCGLLKQFVVATGEEPCEESVGKKIEIYPVESKKSTDGFAIRIRK
jgi:hypothetical protein